MTGPITRRNQAVTLQQATLDSPTLARLTGEAKPAARRCMLVDGQAQHSSRPEHPP